jgi:hypothetical protein
MENSEASNESVWMRSGGRRHESQLLHGGDTVTVTRDDKKRVTGVVLFCSILEPDSTSSFSVRPPRQGLRSSAMRGLNRTKSIYRRAVSFSKEIYVSSAKENRAAAAARPTTTATNVARRHGNAIEEDAASIALTKKKQSQ